MGRERLRDEVIGWGALFLFAAVGSTLIVGCDHGGDGPRVDPVFRAEVRAALNEIERRGLPEWAAYGREREASIVEGECGGGYAYTLFTQTSSYILLSKRWRTEIDVGGQGEVLLEEVFHLRTGIISHTKEMYDLLETYNANANSTSN